MTKGDQEAHDYDVRASRVGFTGRIIDVHSDEVVMPDGSTSQRDVVVHPGAVAVVALRDTAEGEPEVVLVEQYRHPVRRRLRELPAGLLDQAGERALTAAQRELVEEAGVEAGTWHVLADVLSSPGMTDEAVRIYLARDLRDVGRDHQGHEEAEMTTSWVSLSTAAEQVLRGEIENAVACVGLLAAAHAARNGFAGLRGAEAPWPSGKVPA